MRLGLPGFAFCAELAGSRKQCGTAAAKADRRARVQLTARSRDSGVPLALTGSTEIAAQFDRFTRHVLDPTAAQDPEQPTLVDSATSSLDFHMALVMAAHNRALLAMFSAASDLIQQALDALHAQQPDMRESSRKTHRRLCDAIAARVQRESPATQLGTPQRADVRCRQSTPGSSDPALRQSV